MPLRAFMPWFVCVIEQLHCQNTKWYTEVAFIVFPLCVIAESGNWNRKKNI